jgi:hypothetical protein
MKNRLIPELISAASMGVAFGLFGNHLGKKWHSLGRDAFLAYESQYFERHYAVPESQVYRILIWTIVALIAYAIYKGLAFLIARILN